MKRIVLVLGLAASAALGAPVVAAAQTASDSLLARAAQSRVKGAADAPITTVELSDFQCPFCAQFALTTLPQLDSAYVETGIARIIFFNFPLPNHGASWVAAEAAMCAGTQDSFWPMHDRLFASQREWSTAAAPGETFVSFAADLGLDLDAFESCLRHDLVAPLISGDLMQAAGSGARATPTFIINGETVLSGVEPLSAFTAAIEELLRDG